MVGKRMERPTFLLDREVNRVHADGEESCLLPPLGRVETFDQRLANGCKDVPWSRALSPEQIAPRLHQQYGNNNGELLRK